MKNKLFVSLLATALSAVTAGAIPLNITEGPLGYVSRSQYDSWVGPGSNPFNDVLFLQREINLWNGPPDPTDLQSVYSGSGPVGAIAANVENINLSTPYYDTLQGLLYVVLHWGGAGGGSYQAYYLGGEGGRVYAPSGASSAYSLSSARYVPDGGATVMLLGAAFSVIAVARRKFGV
jgi:hypothetical protein